MNDELENSVDVTMGNQHPSSSDMEKDQRLGGLISCRVCGVGGYQRIYRYLEVVHKMTTDEYRDQYPGAPIICNSNIEKLQKGKDEFHANLSPEDRSHLFDAANQHMRDNPEILSRRLITRWENDYDNMHEMVCRNLDQRTDESYTKMAEGIRAWQNTEDAKLFHKEHYYRTLSKWYHETSQEEFDQMVLKRNESIRLTWESRTDQERYDQTSAMRSAMSTGIKVDINGTTYMLRSYKEACVLRSLLDQDIDVKYEALTLQLDNGTRTTPDFYLDKYKLIVEVKGLWTLDLDWDKLELTYSKAKSLGMDYIVVLVLNNDGYLSIHDLLKELPTNGLVVIDIQ